MRAEEVAAPCGHDDQGRHPKLGQFGIVAEKGSRPGPKNRERQCHRAHFLAVYSVPETVPGGYRKNHVRTPLRYVLKDCIGTLITFESQVKTQSPVLQQANTRGAIDLPSSLLTRRRSRGIKRFRRIEEALVPERRIRQRTSFPLLQRCHGCSDHAAVGGIENY